MSKLKAFWDSLTLVSVESQQTSEGGHCTRTVRVLGVKVFRRSWY